ncbi:uncharacterized protein LOC110265170 isoform X4 [Arachis ipaensis]|uniref:uncharacterized protein LOC110265170 isoform X4 n=1 Tax=Arachis ipaensis TaxID=130454 RepID=UPI000A2B0D77|nr:uncharacterized protein LOC110265170 isoform X4 [Arachis ipaensis]XP_025665425.1 uncharacterized protein LOC112764109 isoform X3 [Arachis hypogaea]
MAPPRKLESLEALKKTFQEIGSQCKNTGFLGFKQSNCGGINSSSKASTNAANRCTSETESLHSRSSCPDCSSQPP